jgi:hypothetical protein
MLFFFEVPLSLFLGLRTQSFAMTEADEAMLKTLLSREFKDEAPHYKQADTRFVPYNSFVGLYPQQNNSVQIRKIAHCAAACCPFWRSAC